ncbi:MAG: ATP-binding protein [Chloroflexi bacterium]|nr:ATP-binding protein [Chloroflexota bacterium]
MLDNEIVKLIEMSGLKGNPGVLSLAQVAAVSGNPRWKERLLKILRPRAALVDEPHPFPSPDELPAGGIHLGAALMMNNQPLGEVFLPEDALTAHTLVCGTTGAGKSILLSYLILNLNLSGFTTLVMDTEAEYARRLVPILRDMAVISWKDLRLNFHVPIGGDDIIDTIERVRRLLREEWLREGSLGILSELLHQEYVAASEWNQYPTVRSVLDRFDRFQRRYGRVRDYYESARVRYQVLSDLPVYRCQEGMPIKRFVERSTTINLSGLSPEHLGFVVRDLLLSVARHLEQQPAPKPLIVVMDEASRVINRKLEARADVGEPIVYDLLRSLRKRKGGFIFADQIVSQLPPHVLALCGTRIALLQGSGVDIRDLANCMSLDKDQSAYLLAVPFRRAIIHSPKWIWPSAFLAEIPEVILRQASDEDLEQRMKESLEGLEWKPLEIVRERVQPLQSQEPRRMASHPVMPVGKQALDYLCDVAQRPALWASARDASLKISGWMGNRIRKELKDAGLVEELTLRTGKRGGQLLFIEPTRSGWELLKSLGVPITNLRGRGGTAHKLIQHFVAEWYRRQRHGARVTIEEDLGGHPVDVSVIGDERVAVEVIVTGEDVALEQLHSNLLNYGMVILVFEDIQKMEKIREQVEDAFSEDERSRMGFESSGKYIDKRIEDSRLRR